MLTALIALAVVLGIATAANLVLTFAVIRRLRTLEEGGTGAPDALPAVGTAVGGFSAVTTTGAEVTEADVADGDAFAGFVMVGCTPCGKLIESLAGGAATGADDPLFFVVGDPESPETRRMAATLAPVGRVSVVAEKSPATAAFGRISAFPTLLRLKDGVIAAAGHDLDDVVPASARHPKTESKSDPQTDRPARVKEAV
ncbi:hypothetical protein ACFVHB_15120 [Kitasatospora sp. NPDC127111]|uniref:hypothetical protein n=1 Tax=Kitasatospora sp. NPDC127111 TaxID=3345363 RepID=UPI0036455DD4